MEKNSAANSVQAYEVKLFDTTPIPRLITELITGAHKVFLAALKGTQAALARELDADAIAPTKVDAPIEIPKNVKGLMAYHGNGHPNWRSVSHRVIDL